MCVRNKREDALSLLQPHDMTEWERERERVEFARAAMLYRPLTGNMGSKFVSAGSSDDLNSDTPSKEQAQVRLCILIWGLFSLLMYVSIVG